MIGISDLRKVAEARLKDARVLRASKRTDGAAYMCGYAIEIALKARACATMGRTDFPTTSAEFKSCPNLRTHDLEVLLQLSGEEPTIKASFFPEWNAIASWKPEARYSAIGSVGRADADNMLAAVEILLRNL